MNDGLIRKSGKSACSKCKRIEPDLISDKFIDKAGGAYQYECRCINCGNQIFFIGNRGVELKSLTLSI